MGVTMVKEAIFSDFISKDPKSTLWHGHSFTGNPLGCAAANASLDLLEENPEKYELELFGQEDKDNTKNFGFL